MKEQILIHALQEIAEYNDGYYPELQLKRIKDFSKKALADYHTQPVAEQDEKIQMVRDAFSLHPELNPYHTQELLADEDIVYVPVSVEKELPPFPQIVVVLLDGRLTMMAQIVPNERGHKWETLIDHKNIEANRKCVTHWLKPVKLSSLHTPKNK